MKNKQTIALIVGILCVVIAVVGIFTATNQAFYKIPFLNLIMSSAEDGASIIEQLENAEDELDEISEEEIEEFEEISGMKFEEIEKFYKKPSINAMIRFTNKIEKVDEDVLEDANINMNGFDDAAKVIKIFRTVIVVYGLLVAFLALLGVLLKKMVFPIVSIFVSAGFFLAFVGVIYFILFLIASVAEAMLLNKKNA